MTVCVFRVVIFKVLIERPVKRKRRVISSSSEDSQPVPKRPKNVFIQDEAEISGPDSDDASDNCSEHNSFIDDSETNQIGQFGKITLPKVFKILTFRK